VNPRDICPKCGEARRENAAACPRCGLSIAHWASFSRPPINPSPVLAAAWAKLKTTWDDELAHKKLLDLAANLSELDTAAALYRAQLDERPDDPFARQGLDRAAHLASVLGVQRGAIAPPGPPRVLKALAVVVAVGLVLIVLQILRISLRH
jgi:hypothetical protein